MDQSLQATLSRYRTGDYLFRRAIDGLSEEEMRKHPEGSNPMTAQNCGEVPR